MRSVLPIAGSASSGGAGLQADLRTLAEIGVHGATAVTAITAQNARGVTALHPLDADLVTAQIEACASGFELGATKIGMLGNAAIVEAVAAAIEDLDRPSVVLDPVLASTSGARLLDIDGVQALIVELLPRVLVVTPNVPEAEALSGVRITSPATAREAASRLHDMGAERVIIKGGHTGEGAGLGRERSEHVTDLLFDGRAFHESSVPRVDAPNVRGTGCSYASAVAAYLSLGRTLPDAASAAQRHVAALIARYTER